MPTTIKLSNDPSAWPVILVLDDQPGPNPPDPPQPIPPTPTGAFVVPLTWNQSDTVHSGELGGVQCEQLSVFPFTVPADADPSLFMQFNLSQDPMYGGTTPFTRQLVVSKVAGDFVHAVAQSQGTTVGVNMIVGFNCFPGDVLYINERQWTTDLNPPDGQYSCSPGQNVNYIMSWIATRS